MPGVLLGDPSLSQTAAMIGREEQPEVDNLIYYYQEMGVYLCFRFTGSDKISQLGPETEFGSASFITITVRKAARESDPKIDLKCGFTRFGYERV